MKYRFALLPILLALSSQSLFADLDIGLNVSIAIGTPIESHAVVVDEGGGPPPWAPAHGRRAKAKFYYYPAHEVYRNASTGAWVYYRNGEWSMGMSLPSVIRIGSDSRFVSLEMNSDTPYSYHQEVKRSYPSSVVNVRISNAPESVSTHPGRGHGKSKGNPGRGKGRK